MKNIKRLLSVFFAVVLCAAAFPASAAEPFGATTGLYEIYADGMLLQQNQDAVFAGTAVGGSTVQCTLIDASGKTVARTEAPVNKSNRFSVGFPAPKGGYAEYTVEFRLDGTLFRTLHNVVFGELWLASGQSNMDFPLGQSETGAVMMFKGEKGSKWLRFLQTPPYVEYDGDTELFPLDAQRDVPGAVWFDGESDAVYGVSAVAFFFAQKLQKDLDVPVGVLQSSLGGTSIFTWLSRESIEEDPQILQYLQENDRFIPAEKWQESGHNVYQDMTVNYNKKIAPLRVFRPAGMLWYQGETEIFNRIPPKMYARAFDCLQRLFSGLFGYGDVDRLPIVYTQLVSFNYGGSDLQLLNDQFGRMQALQPKTRAVSPIYDVSMAYQTVAGHIHPSPKQPVGERMAYEAQGLVYGKTNIPSAPYPTRVEARDGSVYVTLSNTGAGLLIQGSRAAGFAVTDDSGVYVPAEAEIVGSDTVRVYSPTLANPTAASYAFAQTNAQANLYAADENGGVLPVSPFITDPDGLCQAWQSRDWAECDADKAWHPVNDTATGFYDTWQGENAALSFTEDGVSGNAMCVTSTGKKQFSVQPVMRYTSENKSRKLPDTDTDYSRYSAITFSLRNTGEADVRLDSARFYTTQQRWFAPAVCGTDDPDCVIPADGAWHEIELDMDALYLRSNECGATFSRRQLSDVRQIRVCFTDPDGKGAQIMLDAFRFVPSAEKGAHIRFVPRFDAADTLWEKLCALGMLFLSPLTRNR